MNGFLTSPQLHYGCNFSARPGCFDRTGNHSRVEELPRSHQPHPIGYPLPHPHPPLLREGPFPCLFCVSSLARGLPSTRRNMVRVIHEGRGLLLPPQQIRYLTFACNLWEDIIALSETGSGLFPLLRILEIKSRDYLDPYGGQLHPATPPSRPFFRGAVDLDKFILHSDRL